MCVFVCIYGWRYRQVLFLCMLLVFFFSQYHCLPKTRRFLTEKRASIRLPENQLAHELNVFS